MGIFSKKKEVDLEEFCRDFYDNNILDPVIEGIDAGAALANTTMRLIAETDSNFANVDSQKFSTEVILLRFELYALAWLHQFGDKLAITQSDFTKRYLHEKKRDDIWENSESYNQTIARSATLGKTPKNPLDRVYLYNVDKGRLELFKLYVKSHDKVCVARVANRLFSDEAWKKGITAGLLVFALCDRFGFDSNFEPTKEAQFRLASVIRLFYDGARQSLEKIKIKN